MGIRELREKYGSTLKGKQAVNRAIRAEVPGGAYCLDGQHLAHELANLLKQRDHPAAPQAQEAADLLEHVSALFADEIAEKYGLGRD